MIKPPCLQLGELSSFHLGMRFAVGCRHLARQAPWHDRRRTGAPRGRPAASERVRLTQSAQSHTITKAHAPQAARKTRRQRGHGLEHQGRTTPGRARATGDRQQQVQGAGTVGQWGGLFAGVLDAVAASSGAGPKQTPMRVGRHAARTGAAGCGQERSRSAARQGAGRGLQSSGSGKSGRRLHGCRPAGASWRGV